MSCTKDTKGISFCGEPIENQKVKDIPPCCTSAFSGQEQPDLASCCGSSGIDSPVMRRIQHCLRKCRWLPFFLASLSGIAFAISFYLSAETTRVLWMIFSGVVITVGALGFFALSIMARKMGACTAKP